MSGTLLLVDDDRAFCSLAAAALRREGLHVTGVHSLHQARGEVVRSSPELVILDRRLPDGDGLEFVPEIRRLAPGTSVVLVTAYGDVASAVEAMRMGCSDYLTKPVELADLVLKVRRTLDSQFLHDRLRRAESELRGRHRLVQPRSPAMVAALAMLEDVAKSPRSTILLTGETGTGKDVLARHVHELAYGSDAPFVHVNCAALPESTFESELFGHERGAFTDARNARRGLVEVANGGALFLDEVGELPLALQAKLLTFLDQGRFRRLGASNETQSSARVIAATNRDLSEAIRGGTFREDLWFRLSVFRIEVPPLRERREDIIPLAEHLVEELGVELGRRGRSLTDEAKARLLAYTFPGNVRELRNVLERSLVLERSAELSLELLALPNGGAPPSSAPSSRSGDTFRVADGPITMNELERRYARYVLQQFGGRRQDAAQALGISYPTFLKRIEGERE